MIVIDVGCAKYGGDESIPYLVEEFSPTLLYGFDPSEKQATYMMGGTSVIIKPWVAWTEDGTIRFTKNGLRGSIDRKGQREVSFDLSSFIFSLPESEEIVLKMDAEGAEYTLLPHLRDTDADKRLKLIWCEFHCEKCGTGWFSADDRCGRCGNHQPGLRSDLEKSMGCKMHQWNR